MARHGLHARSPQFGTGIGGGGDGDALDNFTSRISNPGDVDVSSIAIAPSAPALTTITTTQEFIASVTGGEGFATRTSVVTSLVTDSAAYASITSAEAAANSTPSRTTSSTPSASSSAASKSSSNLGTLIPAIVVPVVVVLLASFGLFWFFMRRRHRKEIKNAEFVMAGKGEKLTSRTNSNRSATTGATAVEKSAPVVTVSEFKPPQSSQGSGPKYSMEDIGVARPLTPRDGSGPGSPRGPPRDRYRPSGDRDRSYQNFSGPRPSTARDRGAPPPGHQGRNRSNSSPAKRGPPPSAYHRGPPPGPGRPSPEFRGAPSPVPRQGPSPIMASGAFPSARSLPQNPRPAPAPPRAREASPTMDHSTRAAPPPHLQAPPPGAFNGSSPISQYSPIVKEPPRIGPGSNAPVTISTTAASKPNTSDGSRAPPPLNTNNLTSTSRSLSPSSPSGNFLTEENMRIARLANSSRLGFFNTSATSPSADKSLAFGASNTTPAQSNPATSIAAAAAAAQAAAQATHSPATTSNPSPKLPPPATRSQLIPNDSPRDDRKAPFNYFSNTSKQGSPTSSTYAPPLSGNNHHYNRDGKRDDDEISDLGEYEDIDAKSDVSSLNEFEKFEFESQRGSVQGGNGSVRGLGFGTPTSFR